MHDMLCDCPFRLGTGECDLDLRPPGARKFPKGCPKRSKDRIGLKSMEKAFLGNL
ncbi:hypothetical protein [Candidatus Formimonas warabiya]|uniref:hypothetical protein n=1 Tax=Formimonas warabiya TaxID=1761012 RepID=UPI001BE4AA0F|nr:hypothetical protein [Candidatus Formimonas warabiya]